MPNLLSNRSLRRIVFIGILCSFIATAVYANPILPSAQTSPLVDSTGVADLVEHVSPAVVHIQVKSPAARVHDSGFSGHAPPFHRFGRSGLQPHPPLSKRIGNGSGFLISVDGFIVTNEHVVRNAGTITVRLHNGQELPAEIQGLDRRTDLALLKVTADEPLPFVEFGNSDNSRVGDWVLAVGSPFGFGGSVTAGIISARGRNIGSGPYDDYLQIDAPINRGSSGGPLFNRYGKVIGVNTAIYSPSGGNVGIGFAIPSTMVNQIIDTLRDQGVVHRGYIGVGIQPVNAAIAIGLGLDQPIGALVSGVDPNGPAAQAGIQPGDVIIAIDGQEVKHPRMLSRAVAAKTQGTSVLFMVQRERSPQPMTIVIGALDTVAANVITKRNPTPVRLGIALQSITPKLRQQLRLAADVSGVLITEVKPQSVAARHGLQIGDIITRVGSHPIHNAANLRGELDQIADDKNAVALLLVVRQNRPRYIAVPLG